MKSEKFISLLRESDYHIDPLGRLVIEKPEILEAIQGAVGSAYSTELMTDVGCSNSGCG